MLGRYFPADQWIANFFRAAACHLILLLLYLHTKPFATSFSVAKSVTIFVFFCFKSMDRRLECFSKLFLSILRDFLSVMFSCEHLMMKYGNQHSKINRHRLFTSSQPEPNTNVFSVVRMTFVYCFKFFFTQLLMILRFEVWTTRLLGSTFRIPCCRG